MIRYSQIIKNCNKKFTPLLIKNKSFSKSCITLLNEDQKNNQYKQTLPTFSLAGKVAVITGGAGGLGSELTKGLLQSGATVAIVDYNLESARRVAQEMRLWYNKTYAPLPNSSIPPSAGEKSAAITQPGTGNTSGWDCDVSNKSHVAATLKAIRETHGSIDILITTAGFCENIPAEDYPAENARRLLDVNVLGTFFCAQESAKIMIKDKKPGSMIFIASMSADIVNYPQPQVPYNMSKAAVKHMAKSFAVEWAPHNIRVNSLSPGYILTPLTKKIIKTNPNLHSAWVSQIPLRRMADPQDFSGAVVYMASDASSYMTGSEIVLDGGYTCL